MPLNPPVVFWLDLDPRGLTLTFRLRFALLMSKMMIVLFVSTYQAVKCFDLVLARMQAELVHPVNQSLPAQTFATLLIFPFVLVLQMVVSRRFARCKLVVLALDEHRLIAKGSRKVEMRSGCLVMPLERALEMLSATRPHSGQRH